MAFNCSDIPGIQKCSYGILFLSLQITKPCLQVHQKILLPTFHSFKLWREITELCTQGRHDWNGLIINQLLYQSKNIFTSDMTAEQWLNCSVAEWKSWGNLLTRKYPLKTLPRVQTPPSLLCPSLCHGTWRQFSLPILPSLGPSQWVHAASVPSLTSSRSSSNVWLHPELDGE